MAGNIIFTGIKIVRRSVLGLMDAAVSSEELEKIQNVLSRHEKERVQFHALRTRQSGPRRFISVHVLVPGEWTVQRGHDLLNKSRTTSAPQFRTRRCSRIWSQWMTRRHGRT